MTAYDPKFSLGLFFEPFRVDMAAPASAACARPCIAAVDVPPPARTPADIDNSGVPAVYIGEGAYSASERNAAARRGGGREGRAPGYASSQPASRYHSAAPRNQQQHHGVHAGKRLGGQSQTRAARQKLATEQAGHAKEKAAKASLIVLLLLPLSLQTTSIGPKTGRRSAASSWCGAFPHPILRVC